MSIPRSIRSTLLCVVLAAGLFAVPAGASAATCAKRGYKIVYKQDDYLVMDRDLKGREARGWEAGAATYACSTQYRRRVFLGYNGVTPDGGVWSDRITFNERWVGWVGGHSDNADGTYDTTVSLANLKTGKTIGHFDATKAGNDNPSVTALALSYNGAIGWITSDLETEVWLRTSGKPRKVATGPEIDLHFLRFDGESGGKRGLVWSTKTGAAK